MKKQSRKLNLNRETLIPLQQDEMGQINGGITPTTATVTNTTGPISSSWCPPTSGPSLGSRFCPNTK